MSVSTDRDYQRVSFAENLYMVLRKKDKQVLEDHNRFAKIASSYLEDGLDEPECVELLMIDGLGREAAENYVSMAVSTQEEIVGDQLPEYSFQFEDGYGRIWSSFDVGKTVKASCENEAWAKEQSQTKPILGWAVGREEHCAKQSQFRVAGRERRFF